MLTFFAIHPIQVETVAWVTERKNILSLLFFFMSFHFYLNFDETQKKRSYMFSLLFFSLALLSKSVAICFVAIPILYKWWKNNSVCIKEILITIPFFVMGLLAGINTAYQEIYYCGAKGENFNLGIMDHLVLSGRIIWFYLYKIVAPFEFIFIYPRWEIAAHQIWQWSYFLMVAVFLGIFFLKRKMLGRGAIVLFTFYLVSIFPALGFINIAFMRLSFVADHFSYMSSPVLILFICSILLWIYRKIKIKFSVTVEKQFKTIGYVLIGTIIILLSFKSWALTRNYQNIFTLWSDVVENNSNARMAYTNLGYFYEQRGDIKEAICCFEKAAEISPKDKDVYEDLVLCYTKIGEISKVICNGEKALELGSKRGLVYKALSLAYYSVGDYDKAILNCDEALKIGINVPSELQAKLRPYRNRTKR